MTAFTTQFGFDFEAVQLESDLPRDDLMSVTSQVEYSEELRSSMLYIDVCCSKH
jgi:hypothetical protein